MEHQETKFSFVYNEVKQRILNGQVLPGNSLPSSRMLCDQYHVSRYTVNRVFDALKKDGLIEIQPRLAPVVLDGEKMPGSEHMGYPVPREKAVEVKKEAARGRSGSASQTRGHGSDSNARTTATERPSVRAAIDRLQKQARTQTDNAVRTVTRDEPYFDL